VSGAVLYIGARMDGGDATVSVVDKTTGCVSALDPGYRHLNHSPTGFNWGYTGSGPAQLAFAILLDHFSAPGAALLFYQDFKEQVIAMINGDRWELSTAEVEQALARIRIFRSRSRTEKACPDST
jgi:hypothetical protein